MLRFDGLFICKFYFLTSLNTLLNAQDQTNSCNSQRIRNTFNQGRFSCLAHDTNSNKLQVAWLQQRRARCWAKSRVTLTCLELAQVDQIVSIYRDAWLYYKLNNIVFAINQLWSSFLDLSLSAQVNLKSSASTRRVLECHVTSK